MKWFLDDDLFALHGIYQTWLATVYPHWSNLRYFFIFDKHFMFFEFAFSQNSQGWKTSLLVPNFLIIKYFFSICQKISEQTRLCNIGKNVEEGK